MVDISERIAAIAEFFDVSADDVVEFDSCGLGDSPEFRVKGMAGSYSVLSEDEADELWERGLDNYLDDAILGGLPSGGRGYCINLYNGEEDEDWMYVYRIG